ncbi:MAG: YIP1 family protein [Bacteroidales bacterium]|nr:YIP1 family protein [Bacteroidales bacterium]
MKLVDKVKNILLKPTAEWIVIEQENTSALTLIITYLIPLALIPGLSVIIYFGLIGVSFFGLFAIKQAIITFVSIVLGVCVSAIVIDNLAPNFGSTKDFRKTVQIIVYSYTPILLASVFQAIPTISFLSIIGLYSLYLLYIGMKQMLKTPEDKLAIYFVVNFLVIIGVFVIILAILKMAFIGTLFYSKPIMQ